MKKWTLIFLLICLAVPVLADQGKIEIYKPKQVFDLSLHLTNESGDVIQADCKLQIRDSAFIVKLDQNMSDKGGGWYNATYNTSSTGSFLCRQNCTQGNFYASNTCDFTIKGDERVPIAISIMMIFVIAVYFLILVRLLTSMEFTEHGMLKILFYVLTFWILLIPVNIAIIYNNDAGGPEGVTTLIELLYQIMVWLNWFISFYFFLWFITKLIKKLNPRGSKDG